MDAYFSDASRPAAEALEAGLLAYHAKNARYPEKIGQLVPQTLASLPPPPERGSIVYGTSDDFRSCWIAYQVHRDAFRERPCGTGSWQLRDYEETQTLRQARRDELTAARQ